MKSFKAREKIIITDRDKTLFRHLFVNKIASVEDIRRDIFNSVSAQAVHRRLVKLSSEKLIEAQVQREKGNRMLYFLTKKGFKEFIADEKTLKRIQLKSDAIEHDLTLLSIKRRFKKFKFVEGFYSENLVCSGILDDIPEVKELRELHPDAIVKLKLDNQIFFLPLEYEASSKYSRRNEKLLAKYYTSPHVPAVLFLSKTKAIEKRIWTKEKAKTLKFKGKFFYALLENLLCESPNLKLTNINQEVLSIS